MRFVMIGAVMCSVLAGCKTTEEAQKFVANKWIGQSADAFFIQNGPPLSVFDMDGGGKLYNWRGGQSSVMAPNQNRAAFPAPAPRAPTISDGRQTTTSSTTVSGNTTVTRTTTTSSSVSVNPAALLGAVAQPQSRSIPIYCEAAIATDPMGKIINVKITNDTRGQWNLSRCAEVFGAQ